MVAWIVKIYGEEIAEAAVDWMEYRRDKSPDDSYFAKLWNCHDVPPTRM
jgi:hypothetical protein